MSRGRSQEGSLIVCVRQSLTSAILSKSERLAEAAINETSHALSRENGAPKRSNPILEITQKETCRIYYSARLFFASIV